MASSSTGRLGEKAAADFLCGKGYTVAEKNYHSRFGEIDIIASDNRYIVFAEVKTRPRGSLLLPREAVDAKKQSRLIKTAMMYLSCHDIGDLQPRFDVIEVTVSGGSKFKIEKINQI